MSAFGINFSNWTPNFGSLRAGKFLLWRPQVTTDWAHIKFAFIELKAGCKQRSMTPLIASLKGLRLQHIELKGSDSKVLY